MPGLLITEVNQKLVGTVDEVTELVSAAKEAGRPAVLFKVTDPTGRDAVHRGADQLTRRRDQPRSTGLAMR